MSNEHSEIEPTDLSRLQEIRQQIANVPNTGAGRANWQAWYGFGALADLEWLLDRLDTLTQAKQALSEGLTAERERCQSTYKRQAEQVSALTRERDEAQCLAYIGDHRFPDLTWRARCEELQAQASASASTVARVQGLIEQWRERVSGFGAVAPGEKYEVELCANELQDALSPRPQEE